MRASLGAGASIPVSFVVELSESELGRSINRHKQIELALSGLHLGNIDVEIADRIAFELLFRLFVALHIR
jgi:hypothetical protein